jgi:chorismate synthase
MASNSFGKSFRVTTFGESHGQYMGAVIDGCPPGIQLSNDDISIWTDRRRPGQSDVTTSRQESDIPEIISGVHGGYTLGTPIAIIIKNKDQRPKDYNPLFNNFRPSHADYCYYKKYKYMDWRGGGRASARETVGRVVAGAIAFKVLEKLAPNIRTSVYTKAVGEIVFNGKPKIYDRFDIYSYENELRCPEEKTAIEMKNIIEKAKEKGDSIGAVLEFVVDGVPVGLGDPVFDKITATISKVMMSIPATRGIEFGIGFDSAKCYGSDNNDKFIISDGEIRTETNNSGGIIGGITNGEMIYGRIAFKPLSTIKRDQATVNIYGEKVRISGREGRHDPCVASRATAIVECSLAIVLLDHIIQNYGVLSVNKDFSKYNIDRFPEKQ